jgi:hypothetical protein
MARAPSTKAFEERFSKIQYADDTSVATRMFTKAQVAAWISAKSLQETDFSYPYEDVLRIFPRPWWNEAIDEVLRSHSEAAGARRFVEALYKVDPASFAAAPQELVFWDIGFARTMRALEAGRDTALPALSRMLDAADPRRWKAAAYLLLLDPSREASLLQRASKAQLREAQSTLSRFGYEVHEGRLRRLWPEAPYHLVFPRGYLPERLQSSCEEGSFPDAHGARPRETPGVRFGGLVKGRTPKGRRLELHHVLSLDPVPADLGVSTSRLVLATRLDTLTEDGGEHFCQHEPDGSVVMDEDETGTHPALRETRVSLVRAPAARFQDWGSGRGENLFRLGGFPVFVQSPRYPSCSKCKAKMMHLLSLDSGLPLDSPQASLDWGSGGVANVFWCDACLVSAWTWACT